MELQTGQTAPDFTLYDSSKQTITLSALKGNNIILLFFPFAFSSVCTAELCMVRDNLNIYNKLNAKVFGISVDSIYTLAKFKQDQGLNFSLLSDFNKEVSQLYNSLHDHFSYGMRGVSKRSAFLIDKEGIIQYAQVLENPGEQPDFNAIQRLLNEIVI